MDRYCAVSGDLILAWELVNRALSGAELGITHPGFKGHNGYISTENGHILTPLDTTIRSQLITK